MQRLTARDTAWAHIASATARSHAHLWRSVAALTPDVPAALPVLGLVGMAGWISGDGALADVALDRADTIPGRATYTMLDLLQAVLDQMLPPTLWDAMADQIRRELDH